MVQHTLCKDDFREGGQAAVSAVSRDDLPLRGQGGGQVPGAHEVAARHILQHRVPPSSLQDGR